jgi:hypothetical protein
MSEFNTLTVETLGAVSEFARCVGDFVKKAIVGFGSIISAVSYLISARAPISKVTAVVSGVIERLTSVMDNVLVSFLELGTVISERVESFGSSAFGPLGELIGRQLGMVTIVVFKAIVQLITTVGPAVAKAFSEGSAGQGWGGAMPGTSRGTRRTFPQFYS